MAIILGCAPEITSARASKDTIEVFAQRLPRGFRRNVEAILQRPMRTKPCRYGPLVQINRPPLQVLPILDWLIKSRQFGACVSRVDFAYDFDTQGPDEADALTEWIDHNVILKWRSRRTHKTASYSIDDGGNEYGRPTNYWCDKHKGRNIALYRKRLNTVRLELRFYRAATVKRLGLNDLFEIPQINPKRLFDHHIKGRRLKESYKLKIVRRIIKEDREREIKIPTRSTSNFMDIYRSRIAAQAYSIVDRICGQNLGRNGIEDVSLDFLGIPECLTWPALISKENL